MASLKSIIRQGKQTRSELKKIRSLGKVPAVVYGYSIKILLLKLMKLNSSKLSVKLVVTGLSI